MTASPWLCLEAIPGLIALETDWQRMVGEQFPAFRALCLQSCSRPVHYVRCPRQCGCNHWVIPRHDGTGAIGVCQCATPACPDLELTPGEITPLEVSSSAGATRPCRSMAAKAVISRACVITCT